MPGLRDLYGCRGGAISLINLNQIPFPPFPDDDGHPPGAPATAASAAGPARPRACPRGSDAIYLLAYNDRAAAGRGYAVGWTLSAWTGSTSLWSANLAAHGTGALITPDHAKAVALRALRDRGVPSRVGPPRPSPCPASKPCLATPNTTEPVREASGEPASPVNMRVEAAAGEVGASPITKVDWARVRGLISGGVAAPDVFAGFSWPVSRGCLGRPDPRVDYGRPASPTPAMHLRPAASGPSSSPTAPGA